MPATNLGNQDNIARGLNGSVNDWEIVDTVTPVDGLHFAGGETTVNGQRIPVKPFHAIWIGTGGDLHCSMAQNPDEYTVLKNIADGTLLPIEVAIVFDSSTCSDMVGLWNR